MPLYSYRNEQTGEIKDVFQSMTEDHVYFENGVEWKRVWEPPQFNMGGNAIDPFKKSDFLKATEGKRLTMGDLMDKSQELSEQRAKINGVDPVKEKFYDQYSKERNGLVHPEKQKEKAKEALKDAGINISN